MIALWLSLAALAALVAGALAAPLWRGARTAGEGAALSVYRAQLLELERDRSAGVLAETEAAAARLEVERRLLRAAKRDAPESAQGRGGRRAVLAVAVLVPLAAGALYGKLGTPGLPDQPIVARAPDPGTPGMAQIRAMVDGLEQRLRADGSKVEDWIMLGRSRLVLGDAPAAAEALRNARKLSPDRSDVAVALGEALIAAAGGVVTPEARAQLEGIVAGDDPRPAFYLALADLQAGDAHKAIAGWRALLATSPADAPWRGQIEQALRRAAQELGIDAEPLLAGARGRAADPIAPEQIRPLVETLEQRLRATGGDAEGWRRLGDARRLLGESEAAREAYGRALAMMKPEDPDYPALKLALDRLGG